MFYSHVAFGLFGKGANNLPQPRSCAEEGAKKQKDLIVLTVQILKLTNVGSQVLNDITSQVPFFQLQNIPIMLGIQPQLVP